MAATDIRPKITLACQECKHRNYITKKNRRNDPDRLDAEEVLPELRQAHRAPRDPLATSTHGARPRFVGRTYPPTTVYEVGREKIREFADAIGDPNPAYRDPDAARALGHPDVIAPPTFAIILTLAAADQVTHDPELGLDYSASCTASSGSSITRPVRAGEIDL